MENPLSADKANEDKRVGRAAILLAAVRLAAVKGLSNVSTRELATQVGLSKSGLYAHFKTREELELATVQAAVAILDQEVLQPAMKARAGKERLLALADSFLSYLQRRVFPRGCFIAAAAQELEARPGPACDLVAEALQQWLALLRQCLQDALALREIAPDTDLTQTVFELQAMLFGANFLFVATGDVAHLAQARAGVENILAQLARHNKQKKNERRAEPRRKVAAATLIENVTAKHRVIPD